MALIDIKINPSRRDLLIFAVLWAIFFVLLGRLAEATPMVLLVAACVTGTAFVISLIFNGDYPRSRQIIGCVIPVVLLTIGGLEKFAGVNPLHIEYALWGVGAVGLVLIALSPAAGRAIYTHWMFAAMPIGWTLSHVILGAVYYLLITPIGLVMRIVDYDPMSRRMDRAAATYWLPREPRRDSVGYFRQF